MATARTRAAKSPRQRVKGETVIPANTLALIERIGVTRAHRTLGVSTTTLHKARKQNIVSKVVEIAATAALSSLGDAVRPAPGPQPFRSSSPAPRGLGGDRAVFLLSVDRSKAQMVVDFARMLDAELVSH